MSGTEIQIRDSSRQDDWNYAKALATAGDQLPRKFQGNPGNVLVAMEYARSLGLPLMQGLIGVQVIDGVPSLSAQTMQALVRRAGHKLRIAGDDRAAWCEIVRIDDLGFAYRADFTLADAERAGLLKVMPDGSIKSRTRNDKPTPWESHPRAMLKARALSECARMACADVLAGVAYTPEEIGGETEIVDAVGEWSESPREAHAAVPGTSAPTAAADAAMDQWEATKRQSEAAETQAARITADEQAVWEANLDKCRDELDLAGIRDLGTAAVNNGWTNLAAQARGAYARVQVHLSEYRTDAADADELATE
jgi:hypothetical protein